MLVFVVCATVLIAGYFIYGGFVDRVFGSDSERPTPATTMQDGVDYVPMSPRKVYLVQLLNIAGLGPIFGPILGALYGPIALLWIVFGCLFAGATHDYFSGMLSIRGGGKSVPDVVGDNLGTFFRSLMRVLSLVLLLLVGVVFVLGPAKLLGAQTGVAAAIWVACIFGYYFLATMLPIDKIIGRAYPVFGALLLFMAFGLIVALFVSGTTVIPTLTLESLHPKGLPLWPLMFITIACGAVSGFHATQSPMMARCLPNERYGRFAFYGAMVGEGLIALVWATLGMSFYQSPEALQAVLAEGGPGLVVNQISTSLLGVTGGFLAVLGVIVLPITSGDTAFRSARLILADFFSLSQKAVIKRLYLAIPLFVVGFVVTQVEFGIIWRYFGFANQTLATIVLWAAAAWLIRNDRFQWIATVPATFMTAVVTTYLMNAPIGFGLPLPVASGIGVAAAAASLIALQLGLRRPRPSTGALAHP